MSALGAIAAGAVGGIWKIAAIVLAIMLLTVASGGGVALWMATAARDEALADRDKEKDISAEYGARIREQNRAVDALAATKTAAEARALAAQQLAAANSKRYDKALTQAAEAKATTCPEAMPVVNQILEAIR